MSTRGLGLPYGPSSVCRLGLNALSLVQLAPDLGRSIPRALTVSDRPLRTDEFDETLPMDTLVQGWEFSGRTR